MGFFCHFPCLESNAYNMPLCSMFELCMYLSRAFEHFFLFAKPTRSHFQFLFPLIKNIFAKVAIYFYYMSRGEMDFIHARTRVVSWGHKSVLLVTTFLGCILGDICS